MGQLVIRSCTAIAITVLIVSTQVLQGSCSDETLNRKCTNETDCVSPNSTCTDSVCVCKEGFIEVVYPSRCLPVPESKEERCEDDMQCTEAFTLGSFCGEGGFCDCHPNYHFSGGLCLRHRAVGINDRCTQDRECAVEGSYCKDGLFCSCEEDKVASKDHKRCLSLAKKLNDKCEEDIQCTENLQLGAQCKVGTCQCREQHHFAELRGQNGCYKTKKIGDVCNIVNECTSKPDPLRVTCNAVCECNTPYKPTEDKMMCSTSGKKDGPDNGSSAAHGGMIALVASCLLAKLMQ